MNKDQERRGAIARQRPQEETQTNLEQAQGDNDKKYSFLASAPMLYVPYITHGVLTMLELIHVRSLVHVQVHV